MVGEHIMNNWILQNLLRLVLQLNMWSTLVNAFEKKYIIFTCSVFVAKLFDQGAEN